jgi:hypothetical protein
MGRKKTDDAIREANCGRVRFLLEHLWASNQSRMAADLGVTQSLVSKICRGSQGPGREFLAALARQPGVHAEWVLRGEGTPLVPSTHGTLPVACGILPGWPERHPELMTGERSPVAAAYDKPSRYWYRIPADCPALRAAELALLPGDLLLLDADVTAWLDRLSDFVGRMFGVRVRRGEQASYQLALLRRDSAGLVFDAFTEHCRLATVSPSPAVPPAPAASIPVGVRAKRKVRSLTSVSEKPKPVAAPTTPPSDVPFVRAADIAGAGVITPDDIVAVRVGLYRG